MVKNEQGKQAFVKDPSLQKRDSNTGTESPKTTVISE
jgi:hypothetical protein